MTGIKKAGYAARWTVSNVLLPFKAMRNSVWVAQDAARRTKEDMRLLGHMAKAAKAAAEQSAEGEGQASLGFEQAMATRRPGALSVTALRCHFLWRKRAALAAGSILALIALVGIAGALAIGSSGMAVLSLLSVVATTGYCFILALGAQHRIWQLDTRRLSADEKGGLEDFKKETAWVVDTLSLQAGKKFYQVLGLVLLLALLCGGVAAHAQSMTIGEIAAAAMRATDKSRQGLVAIYGQVVNNPLAAGGAGGQDTIIAKIFQITNAGMLAIAMAFAGYLAYRQVGKAANEGSIFDRQSSLAMGPIRLLLGITALAPTANGWALSQLLMLWGASVMGVGLANLATDASVEMLQDGTTMVVQPVLPSTVNLAHNIFTANLCMHGINAGLAQSEASGGLVSQDGYVQQRATASGFVLRNKSFVCGGADVNSDLAAQNGGGGWFSSSIDTSEVRQAHLKALQGMQESLDVAARDFVNAVTARRTTGTGQLLDAGIAIQSAAQRYESLIAASINSQQSKIAGLSKEISNVIKTAGWWSLGGWYQTYAQAGNKVSNAVGAQATTYGISSDGDPAVTSVLETVLAAYRAQRAASAAAAPIGSVSTGDYSRGAAGSDAAKVIGSIFEAPGQRIINFMANVNLGGESQGQLNPLIKMKNLGDYVLGTGEVALGTYATIKAVSKVKDGWSLAGVALKVGNALSSIGDAIDGVLEALGPFVTMGIMALMVLGGTLAVYIPLVPYIMWFGAAINWLVVVGQAVVAAPMWWFAVMMGEGDGMGVKSTAGWILFLNVLIRPVLMVAGFALGGAAIIVGGTFLNWGFGMAIANAQFDSISGFVTIIISLVVYCSMCLNLIHRCFDLIFIIPDQTIALVGGHGVPTLGREFNDGVKSSTTVFGSKAESMHRPGARGGPRAESTLAGDGMKR
ncbi:DotA/TraY family protein [Achromobacter insuavis]|uniref:DotA/TraY family protein n=1 Tax=Achromobacter insuavis TaxID=1287735 RepID=UPI001F139747|nr:DotA/TraY family protein [Achromobacter insuavis]